MAKISIPPVGGPYQCNLCKETLGAAKFYGSNLSRCKECVKKTVRANREANINYYRNYDRRRYRDNEHRQIAARKSAISEAGISGRKRYSEKIKGAPIKKARTAIGNALRSGKITKADACFFCHKDCALQAHHSDYSRPLDVFWLCASCHGKLHTINGDFLKDSKS